MALAVMCVIGASGASAQPLKRASRGGPLSGDWAGYITGSGSYGARRQHITITIDARETAGSWRISARCQGRLTLDSISGGYHHYLRHVAAGASCAGGDIDCLKRAGTGLYDAVTSHLGGAWDTSGTLRRIRR